MHSLARFPICRINCQPDALIVFGMPVLALLAIISISLSGFGMPLKLVLILSAAGYAMHSFQQYRKQAAYILESNAQGILFLSCDNAQHALEHIVWRDWGFLIEYQAQMQGKSVSKFWLSARLPTAQLRQLRLLIRLQNRGADNSLPTLITNPVL
jgi:hypothetical protein